MMFAWLTHLKTGGSFGDVQALPEPLVIDFDVMSSGFVLINPNEVVPTAGKNEINTPVCSHGKDEVPEETAGKDEIDEVSSVAEKVEEEPAKPTPADENDVVDSEEAPPEPMNVSVLSKVYYAWSCWSDLRELNKSMGSEK